MRIQVLVAAIGVVAASLSNPLIAEAQPLAKGDTACTSLSNSLLDEQSTALDRLAQLGDVLTTDEYQLSVARRFGSFDRAKELQADITKYQPEYDLLKAQQQAISKDIASLKRCSSKMVVAVSAHSRGRTLEQLKLFYVADLKKRKNDASVLDYEYGIAKQFGDKMRAKVLEAQLLASRAAIAKDKRQITAIESALRALTT